jgi:DnaJ-class molecular chaperone
VELRLEKKDAPQDTMEKTGTTPNTGMAAEAAQICQSCNGTGLGKGNYNSTDSICGKCKGTGKLRHT